MSSALINFFSVESGGKAARLKFEDENGQTDSEKMARASNCDVSGATSPCTVTRAILKIHDQPESICWRPVAET